MTTMTITTATTTVPGDNKDTGCFPQVLVRLRSTARMLTPTTARPQSFHVLPVHELLCGYCSFVRSSEYSWGWSIEYRTHQGFVQDWDVLCLEQLACCKSQKPILTTYAGSTRDFAFACKVLYIFNPCSCYRMWLLPCIPSFHLTLPLAVPLFLSRSFLLFVELSFYLFTRFSSF